MTIDFRPDAGGPFTGSADPIIIGEIGLDTDTRRYCANCRYQSPHGKCRTPGHPDYCWECLVCDRHSEHHDRPKG